MSPVTLHNPGASGRPSGYSHAASANGIVLVSGQVAAHSVIEAGEGLVAEFASALAGVVAALASAGASPSGLLSLRMFVTDLVAYESARPALAPVFRDALGGHYPAATLVEVAGLIGGAGVEIEGLAIGGTTSQTSPGADRRGNADAAGDWPARIRLRLAPADARYAGGLVPGSKAMEIFSDLETELSLIEAGDEGLLVAYELVEFLAPLHVGEFVEGRARVVSRGRSSRAVEAELYKVVAVDSAGCGAAIESPQLVARAHATIVVGRTTSEEEE